MTLSSTSAQPVPTASPQLAARAGSPSSWLLWLVSVALLLPAFEPYRAHFAYPPKPFLKPTGFIQTDMPYYMANARSHFADGFSLTYGLPFSPDEDTPRVYFQPHTLLLGVFWRLTGWQPQTVFLLFGIVSGVIGMRVAVAVYQSLFGLGSLAQWLGLVCWTWGGGVLVLLGYCKYFFTQNLDDLFYLDPFGGMWFLNLGRNFIYPTEAYYHALFLGMVYLVIHARFGWSTLLLLVLSMSHPFTGIEALLIVLTWAILERFWMGNRQVPARWIGVLGLLLAAHITYYLVVLNALSADHRSLQEQWTLDWTYEAKHFVPAYALVGALALWAMRNVGLAGRLLANINNRFFLVWFLVAFALANHEFAFKPPVQPLHFTRGYVWMPLFLLGGTALLQLLTWLRARPSSFAGVLGLVALLVLFLADNAVFLTTFHWRHETAQYEVYLDDNFAELAEFIAAPENRGALIVSPNWLLNMDLIVYTGRRSHMSHLANTPHYEKRKREVLELYSKGTFIPEWRGRTLLLIADDSLTIPEALIERGAHKVFANDLYQVYRVPPQAK